jgi:hypothetical protein
MNTFLAYFTVFPLRIIFIVLLSLVRWLKRIGKKILRFQWRYIATLPTPGSWALTLENAFALDLLKASIIIASSYLLSFVDPSWLYHSIRGQSMVKLYVIFNVCEVADKLLCSFGLDIMNSFLSPKELYGAEVLNSPTTPMAAARKASWRLSKMPIEQSASKVPLDQSALKSTMATRTSVRHLRPFTHFLLAILYTFCHSIVLFYQVITLNVAINSYNNALLTLLLSNQFVEIKGSVFKKFEKENLFQLSCAGNLLLQNIKFAVATKIC